MEALPFILALAPAVAVLLLFIVAPIHILLSRRSHGGAKFGWFLTTFFLPFFGYIAFLILTQPPKSYRKAPVWRRRSLQSQDIPQQLDLQFDAVGNETRA